MSFGRPLINRALGSVAASVVLTCGLAVGLPVQTVSAQSAAAQGSPESLLKDFVHYIKIDSREAAALVARQLAGASMTDEQVVSLIENGRAVRFADFEDALVRASKKGGDVADAAAELDSRFRAAKIALVRNPNEIAKNIAKLTENALARNNASTRLVAAGEYAMPQLLDALLQRNDSALRLEVSKVMVQLGRHAVIPLCTSLLDLDPASQELVVNVLADIGYKTALPWVVELQSSTSSTQVADACTRAMLRMPGGGSGISAADAYLTLANDYYNRKTELINFPQDSTQLLWNYDPAIGLLMSEIVTPLFDEAMAMRCAEDSLRLNAGTDAEAVAIWVASNLRRDTETDVGYENPEYPDTRRDATYYAVAAGSDTCQRVLRRAIDDRDTPLVRRAIAALDETASAGALWRGSTQRAPLLDALSYSDRRVRYEAALVLAGAQPNEPFAGADRVVPTLASAVRDVSDRYAILITQDREVYDEIRPTLEAIGFAVLPHASNFDALATPISQVPGVDFVTLVGSTDWTRNLVERVRISPSTSAAPMLAMVDSADITTLSQQVGRDDSLEIRSRAIGEAAMRNSIESLLSRTGNSMLSESDIAMYRDRAVRALRDLAVARNRVLRVEDASASLVRTLEDNRVGMTMSIADVLSWIPEARAQTAIFDRAMQAEGNVRVDLLGKVAESARRFGNRLEQRQVNRLIDVAKSGNESEATAAAGVLGSLNLPNADIADLIMSGR
ncbi:MAG: hypothetical protein H6815_06590 [Phycisphaeraceae bacterium]|nr:hypothetical protein [Phycisphaerales bacterium]MCB9860106.1 hypothetical protein [Phycisphaeraceae bacterium]